MNRKLGGLLCAHAIKTIFKYVWFGTFAFWGATKKNNAAATTKNWNKFYRNEYVSAWNFNESVYSYYDRLVSFSISCVFKFFLFALLLSFSLSSSLACFLYFAFSNALTPPLSLSVSLSLAYFLSLSFYRHLLDSHAFFLASPLIRRESLWRLIFLYLCMLHVACFPS